MAVIAVVLLVPATAQAAITTPPGSTFTVPADAAHRPIPFDVVATGFAPGARV